MREIVRGVVIEDKYPGVIVGAIAAEEGSLLVDCPIRVEDAREWVSRLSDFGRPRYVALLDAYPDRVLGARALDLPSIAHDETRLAMATWPDTFKGAAHPIGAEADRLKRITGVTKAVPEVTFSDELELYLGGSLIEFWHRPGPMAGSMWVVFHDSGVAFIGDTVSVSEPPYLGEADIEAWLESLDDLRELHGYKLITSHDGQIKASDVNAMGRFLRKIPVRLARMADRTQPLEAAPALASRLMQGMKVASSRRDQAVFRLESGLVRLYRRTYGADG
jgi:cyclase